MSTNCAHVDWSPHEPYFRSFFQRAEAARVPLSGSLELTRHCNLRCVHCYLGPQESVQAGLGHELSTEEVLGILDQAVEAGCLNLLITGGDPLIRSDFATIYRYAKLAGLDVTVFTNGTLVTDSLVEMFQDLPPRIVEVTLYGATAETYKRITGVPGSYERCLAGIRLLHNGGVRLGLKTMLMTLNSHEYEAIESMGRSYGTFHSDPVLNACLDGGRGPMSLRLDPDEAVRLEFASLERRQEWLGAWARFPELAPSDRVIQCGAGETAFHVTAFGDLQACLMLAGRAVSLRTGTFAEGWAGLANLRDTRAGGGNRCAGCPRRSYCGYCPGLLVFEHGDWDEPSTYQCALADARLRAITSLSQEEN